MTPREERAREAASGVVLRWQIGNADVTPEQWDALTRAIQAAILKAESDAVGELVDGLRPFADAGQKFRSIWDAGDFVVLPTVISSTVLPPRAKELTTWSFRTAKSLIETYSTKNEE